METDQSTLPVSTTTGIAVAIGVGLVATFIAILALGRALSGGGGGTPAVVDAGAGEDSSGGVVSASLTEFTIAPAELTVTEGGAIEATNEGSAAHNLAVRDTGITTPDLAAGESAMLDVSALAPGTYDVLCTIPGHEAAGMVGTLVVGDEEGGGQGDSGAEGGDTADPGEMLTGEARADFLRANYEASVTAFPAETEAFGNQVYTGEPQDDGSVLFELSISEVEWEVAPGDVVQAIAYNGMVPGPALKMDVGTPVTIRVINDLEDQPTSLHPHGIFMHPLEADGVGYIAHDPIMPGDTYEVTFTPQEISVGMYHGHDNGLEQVINGAFGAWIVGDMPLPPEADNVVDEKVMVLNDAGTIGLTLNAKSFPATEPYVLQKGEQLLLHYYNEGLTPHPMHLHNNAQLVIAKDGYPLAQPYFADTVNIAPGERYTVVIFGEVPGTWVYHCHILSHVEQPDGSVFGMFTALIVEDSGDPAVDGDTGRTAGDGRNAPPSSVGDLYRDAPPTVTTGGGGGGAAATEPDDGTG